MRKQLYYADVEKYWDKVKGIRQYGCLPPWCCEFIAINHDKWARWYSLTAPLCIAVKKPKGVLIRPKFEQFRFKTHKEAKEYAKMVARSTGCFVVNCCN